MAAQLDAFPDRRSPLLLKLLERKDYPALIRVYQSDADTMPTQVNLPQQERERRRAESLAEADRYRAELRAVEFERGLPW